MPQRTCLDAYELTLYRQDDGFRVAEVPAIAGRHALMPTWEEALAEAGSVFDVISEEAPRKGGQLPADASGSMEAS